MAIQGISLLLCLSAFFTLFALSAGDVPFNRTSFPSDFIFGVASSAYQYEGAAGVGGRGPSIWDTFTEKYPDKIKDGSNGIIALDSYNQYKEHVGLMKDLGFETYRFSISWSRILPRGKLSGGVNQEGITYYNNLIDELLSNGLLPFVTMFHWDVPQALEDEYGGFLDPRIVIDFRDYAELVFREFGDRVKHWITMNEPWVFINFGYVNGIMAPGRCSEWMARNCTGGDSSTEPYLVAHHILLAHAAAVKVYRDKYQTSQKGKIGITNYAHWVIPFSNSSSDIDAAKRALAFTLEWFLYPITFGQYPSEMADKVGKRLPEFSKEQSLMLKGSYDFLGLNYYTTFFAMDVPCTSDNNIDYYSDFCAVYSSKINGVSIGPQGATEWFYIYPEGLQDVLVYTKKKYNNPVIYITENGINEVNTGVMSLEDDIRVDFYHNHLTRVRNAIMEGVDVRGYFAWTLLDDFEWSDGYTTLFGLFYVDRNDGLKFYPRKSASWFKNFLLKGNF